MAFPPNLYLIGTQKGGTTFLATLLEQHGDVCLANPKEPDFYTRNWGQGQGWYRQRFDNLGAAYLLDASTSYSAAKVDPPDPENDFSGVPERIHTLSADAKFIYILRNPVKRTHSSYWHSVRGGYENKCFREAIESNSYYLRLGQYYDQMQLYLQYFDADRFHLLLFEDFVKAPEQHANECLRFLGLEPLHAYTLESGRNQSFQYRSLANVFNQILSPLGGLNKVAKKIKPWMPDWVVNMAYQTLAKEVDGLSAEDEAYLQAYFKPHNERLRDAFGVSINLW